MDRKTIYITITGDKKDINQSCDINSIEKDNHILINEIDLLLLNYCNINHNLKKILIIPEKYLYLANFIYDENTYINHYCKNKIDTIFLFVDSKENNKEIDYIDYDLLVIVYY